MEERELARRKAPTVYGKTSGHSYRRFHTHVGKMVALSGVSMNNLESFAVENFSAGLLVLSFRPFSCITLARQRTIVELKREHGKRHRLEPARRTGIGKGTWKAVSNVDRVQISFYSWSCVLVTREQTFCIIIPINEHLSYAY